MRLTGYLVYLLLFTGSTVSSMDLSSLKHTFIKALRTEQTDTLLDLINHDNSCINAQDENQQTLLHWAAQSGFLVGAELLINKGAQVNAQDQFFTTPLHLAAESGNTQVAELLIRSNAQVNTRTIFKETPLHCAVSLGYVAITELLLNAGAHLNAVDTDGEIPMCCAMRNGHTAVLELLLQRGASNVLSKSNKRILLNVALTSKFNQILEVLVNYMPQPLLDELNNPRIQQAKKNQQNLVKACISNNTAQIISLLKNNVYATPTAKAYLASKVRDLFYAVQHDDISELKKLLKQGFSIHIVDANKNTLLHIAFLYKSKKALEFILSTSGSTTILDKKNKLGLTPIELTVATTTHLEFLKEFIFKLLKGPPQPSNSRECMCEIV
ncbi:ankyrin repeat domain-containing protein [Candidatus Dependentiae bacterium]|nr:ankyrin repeat domain-containing protein [Candidatus Dependentiae bacterium]